MDSSFVRMKAPAGYDYLSNQKSGVSLNEVVSNSNVPTESRVRRVFEKTVEQSKITEHKFFAELFAALKSEFPFFTSRDVRNIQRSIDGRVMDFELPSEWFENPETFFRQTYAVKKVMLTDLMKQNMKGLSFADIRLNETIRYLDNMVRIQDTGRERRITELATEFEIRREAERRS